MEGPRPPQSHEYSNVLAFLKDKLRPENDWGLSQEYPTALTASNMHNMRIITRSDKVVSHAVMKPLIIKTPVAAYKVAAIGSVVTDENHRNTGLSRQVISECLSSAQEQGCEIAVLWTNLYDFYRKFNFELAGYELSYVIDQPFTVPNEGLKFVNGAMVSAEAIMRVYSQHSTGSIRSLDEIRKFMQIPNTHLYTAWDRTGQLAAYAVEGKGADLTNYIHEWGGQVPAIMALLAHIKKQKTETVTVIVPRTAQNMSRQLETVCSTKNVGYLGMVKILDHNSVLKKVQRLARAIGIQDLVCRYNETQNSFSIGCGDDVVDITDEKEWTRIIFGPEVDWPHQKQETKNKLNQIFPMPLWFWGWDSV